MCSFGMPDSPVGFFRFANTQKSQLSDPRTSVMSTKYQIHGGHFYTTSFPPNPL